MQFLYPTNDQLFRVVPDLQQMGADIKVIKNKAYINGVEMLQGMEVEAEELRGGAAQGYGAYPYLGFHFQKLFSLLPYSSFQKAFFVFCLGRCGPGGGRLGG